MDAEKQRELMEAIDIVCGACYNRNPHICDICPVRTLYCEECNDGVYLTYMPVPPFDEEVME